MPKHISSPQNPFIKQLLQLKSKSRERKKAGRFVIEGLRELSLAIAGGYTIETVVFYEGLISEEQTKIAIPKETELISISKSIYQKLAHRITTEGVIAVAQIKAHDLDALKLKENPLILVAEAPEKPGNIGALLRTADAAHLDAVIIANPKTDLYNPNIVRSSVGCVFTNTIATGTTSEIISYLKQNSINIYCAALQASVNYTTVDFTTPSAVVVGTEATGLSEEWLMRSTQNIIIPMGGTIDSMNVSVAAGILVFEAKRQRDFN